MVSAKNKEASKTTAQRLNKNGSIGKKTGRQVRITRLTKQQVPVNIDGEESEDDESNEDSKILKAKTKVSTVVESNFEKEKRDFKAKIAQIEEEANEKINQSELQVEILRELSETRRVQYEKQIAHYEEMLNEQELSSAGKHLVLHEPMQERAKISVNKGSSEHTNEISVDRSKNMTGKNSVPNLNTRKPDLGGYKVKISKFLGKEDDDYDVWWEDLQAFFNLYDLDDKAKISLFNAHLGGEARKFIQNEDLSKMDTVEQLHEILRGTFSDKYDWQNVLMNISQKPDEKIRPFSVRLKVAARKAGFTAQMLDTTCVNYLKRSCGAYVKSLLNN